MSCTQDKEEEERYLKMNREELLELLRELNEKIALTKIGKEVDTGKEIRHRELRHQRWVVKKVLSVKLVDEHREIHNTKYELEEEKERAEMDKKLQLAAASKWKKDDTLNVEEQSKATYNRNNRLCGIFRIKAINMVKEISELLDENTRGYSQLQIEERK